LFWFIVWVVLACFGCLFCYACLFACGFGMLCFALLVVCIGLRVRGFGTVCD